MLSSSRSADVLAGVVPPSRHPSWLRSGWIPAAVMALVCCVALARFGVAALDIAKYGAWLLYGVIVPGTLVWRALRGTPRTFVEDVAAGTATGFALEILVYIGLRTVGAPMLILAWPALVIAAFAAVPRLRRHWRPTGYAPVPPAWAWALVAAGTLIVFWFAFSYFRTHPLTGDTAGFPYVDLPYHLALAVEVKHHAPPTWPYVLDLPLRHHWFPHADIAASSWATGMEPRDLLLRMPTFPFLAITVLLTSALATRLTKRWWPGVVAVVLAFFVAALAPFAWSTGSVFFDSRLVETYAWASPTQLAAFALFAPVLLLLVDRLRGEPGGTGHWVLIGLLLAAVMGSKATYLPLTIAGLAFVAGVQLLVRRRIDRPVLVAGGLALVLFAFSTFVLYGGGSYGMEFAPFEGFRILPLGRQVSLDSVGGASLSRTLLLALAILALISWLTRMAGIVPLLANRDRALSAPVLFLAGFGLAGLAVVLLFQHPGGSQLYFLHSVHPVLSVLAAAGLSALVPESRWRPLAALAGALAFGAVVAAFAEWVGPARRPSPALLGSRAKVWFELLVPYVVIGVILLAAAVALYVLRRRLNGLVAALAVAAVTGTGLAGTVDDLRWMSRVVAADGFRPVAVSKDGRPIPDEALAAARWLRAESDVDDVVATNTHCRTVNLNGCDNRHFWIAAYTERRVVVEGWGYTDYAIGGGKSGQENMRYLGFQDPDRLGENDAAFQHPSGETLGLLKRKYGVRWLFVDERYDKPSPGLADHATVRHRTRNFTIYELTSTR